MKRFVKIVALILSLMLLSGCAKSDGTEVADTNGDGKLTCTLEIRCDTLLGSLDKLSEGKAALVPEDGVLLPVTEVEFTGGNSVFDVFRQTLKNQKIHFEYVDASAYDSVYIEGIGNLYEFDCGPQSGWMYSVNGVFPDVGTSSYTVSSGDVIALSFTCNMGEDIGNTY